MTTSTLQNSSQNKFICSIDNMAIIEVSGEDASSYLQGQLTNDINLVENNKSQLSAYCTPKGRTLALFRIFSINGKLYLVLAKDLLQVTLKRLKMFVLMSKVVIEDVTEQFGHIGISHTDLKSADLILKVPESINDCTQENGNIVIKISDNLYECWGETNNLKQITEKLELTEANLSEWSQQQILNGIPQVSELSKDMFIPQMLNLHFLDGINFKKGCYTGQEVIARLHYLGKMKRLMFAIKFNSESKVQVGDKLYSPASSSGQGAGSIVSVEASNKESNEYIALSVIELKVIEKDEIYLDEQHQIKIQKLNLPYEKDLLAREEAE